jgi:pimeloyl-ACP methyl ester carboxylesterase
MPVSDQQLQTVRVQVNGLAIQTRMTSPVAPTARPIPERPVIVLLHGLLISSLYLLPTAALLGKTHRVLVPDLPGFGSSTNPSHIYSLQEQADFLVDWLDVLAIQRPIFLGNSLGCQVLVDLAMRCPERAAALILTSPTVDPYFHGLVPQFVRLLLDAPLEDPRLFLPLARDLVMGGPVRALRTFQAALADPLPHKLTRVQAPTLVVRGDRDPVVSQRWAEEVTALLPRARLQVLTDAPHCVTFTTPQQVAAAVYTFLEEC